MPTFVVLLIVAFFAAGLALLAAPVTPARLERFILAQSLEPTDAERDRLRSYLGTRRRIRVLGVLIAAAIGLDSSIPEQRADFNVVLLLSGWFAGAVAVELHQRAAGVRPVGPTRVAYWWDSLSVAMAVITVLWTAAAVWWRSGGVPSESLLRWAIGAMVTLLVLRAVARPAAATSPDVVRGLHLGGVALALSCLAQLWVQAVPGPYEQPPRLGPIVWLVGIGLVLLSMATLPPSTVAIGRLLVAYAVVAALPLAYAVPVRLAQEAPLSAREAGAGARMRMARLDALPAAQAELGLKPDPPAGGLGDPQALPVETVGRVDLARPAPEGTNYQLFAFDRRTRAAVSLYGADGASWYGEWSRVLPARYSWLADLAHDPMAVSTDPESGVLWFRSGPVGGRWESPGDLQPVLMLVRNRDSYVYWAAPVPAVPGV